MSTGGTIRMRALSALALAAALGAASCGDNIHEPPPPTLAIARVDTVAPESIVAGNILEVTCRFFDAENKEFFPEESPALRIRFAPGEGVMTDGDGNRIPTRAGDLEITCVVPDLALFDATPAITRVEPGPVAQLVTTLDRDLAVAGDTVNASCEAYDAFGNRVEDAEPDLVASPDLAGNTIDGLSATMTGAGVYQMACDLPVVETAGATLEVLPGLPASMVVSPSPDRPVYARGEIIELVAQVFDRYQNLIPDAEVAVTSVPAADVADGARFRYFADGLYQLTATVQGPIDPLPLAALSASASVLIDGSGPSITCNAPGDGAILDRTPGDPVVFGGQVTDLSGVSQVMVNGSPVSVDGSGNFSVSLGTDFGINFVDLSATDEFGKQSSRVCSFMVADRWAPESGAFGGAVSMNLRPGAIDDRDRSGGLDSLADLLFTVVNSSGLKSQIHQLLLAANPLKNSCDIDTIFGCVFSSRVDYLSSNFAGTNTIAMAPISGGLRLHLRINDARLRLRIRATGGIDTSGWVNFSTIDVRLVLDTRLSGGRPRVTIRPGSVSTTVGSFTTNFGGVDGWILDNIIIPLIKDKIRSILENQVSSLIRTSLGAAVDGVFANLDISSLGTTFDVPRLDGGPDIPMTFTPGFSSLNTNSNRLQFGLSTRFDAPPAHARPSLGAPVERPLGPVNPSASGDAAIAIHSGVLGQALHALWRAGLFDATLTGGTSFPDGAQAVLRTGLPPAVRLLGGNRVEMALGDVAVTLTYPGVFPEPIDMILGIRTSLRFDKSGDDITFSDLTIDELYFTSLSTSIDPQSRDVIEGFLADVLSNLVVSALEGALPALPIPSFELPGSLSQYGLPAGAVLGLGGASLVAEIPELVLAGFLSIQ